MKLISITLLMLFFTIALFAQQPQYQTYTAIMKISAVKEGEQFQWENKNITVRLDYKTGEFISRLKNHDFEKTGTPAATIADSTEQEMEYTLKGIFPVYDIINQKSINQNYTVELILNNDDLRLRESVLFDMQITRPNSGQNSSYRVFSLHGKLYNNQLNLPAFEGYDDEIEIWLLFNGYMSRR